jgi:hypothetical protein
MRSLRRIRNRIGRCYELCGRVMINEPDAKRYMLVHGRITPPSPSILGFEGRMFHAWIELPDGRVYDAVYDQYYSKDDYRNQFQAVPIAVYRGARRAARMMVRHNHYGPWYDHG